MKLLSSTQISWSEPWLFLVRIRESWAWRQRLLIALGLSILMFLAIYFLGPGQRSLAAAIGLGLACGFVLVALLDVGNLQRDVTVKDDGIIVGSSIGRGWFETFKFEAIQSIQLLRPEEWERPWGSMIIRTAGDNFLVAVPKKVSLDTLADVLHRLGLDVTLSGWTPSESDTRLAVRDEVELDPAAARGQIEIRPVGEGEPPLLAPAHIAVQVLIAFGPLLLALVGAITAGVLLVRHWSLLSVLDRTLSIGGAILGLVLAFVYLVLIGQFIIAAYGLRVARRRLPERTHAMFDGTEDDLVGVELFDRPSWTAAIAKSSDYGFLRIDRSRSRLLFEGNKYRWTLPTSALTACRIEESIVGSEGHPNAERRYYVVLAAAGDGDGEPWEQGLIYVRTEMGNDTPETRFQRAQLLFRQVTDAL